MANHRILHIESLETLRALANKWDDLWLRGEATLPSLRAEMLARWVERFARAEDFFAVAVETSEGLSASLPLLRRGNRPSGMIKLTPFAHAAVMPCNEWSAAGDLLLDENGTSGQALQCMADGIKSSGVRLLRLDEVELDSTRWRRFIQICTEAGMSVAEHHRWEVGRVTIDHDWPDYKTRWSRKHRQKMAQAARRLAERSEVRLDVHSRLAPDEVEPILLRCFKIEDDGWKGAAGTSVLRTPGMAEYYIRQARLAAEWGQLEIVTLNCDGRPISFSYGLTAKGVFHSTKIGYDQNFAKYNPGQLLRYYLLERCFADSSCKAIDFQGEMTPSHEAWLPKRYSIGRVLIAPRAMTGRMAAWGYKHIWPSVRKLLRLG